MVMVVVAFYSIGVYLEFRSQVSQLKMVLDGGGVAGSFVDKNKLALITRGFTFLLAPLLGVIAGDGDYEFLLQLFLICTVIALCLVVIEYIQFKKMINEEGCYFSVSQKIEPEVQDTGFLYLAVSAVAFSITVNAPFVMNIIASIFIEHAVWLVQLAPISTALSTVFIVYAYDVRLYRDIDKGSLSLVRASRYLFERVLGRLLALCVASWVFFWLC